MKKVLVGLLVGALMLTSTPVAAEEVISENAMPEEAVELVEPEVVLTVGEPETAVEPEVTLTVGEPEAAALESVPAEESDTALVELAEAEFSFTAEAFGASNGIKYYSQPAYKVKSGYNVVMAYVRAADGSYPSRLFFVYDKSYPKAVDENWKRYDHSAIDANEYLSEYELKDSGLYVPVTSGSAQKDNSATALDESKVPVIDAADVQGINYAWKTLADVPFAKVDGKYEYAYTGSAEPTPTPTPTPIVEAGKYEAVINSNTYTVEYTASVQYDGRAHVWEKTNLTSKALKTKINDLSINVYRNGTLLAPGDVSIAYKNNANITGFAGKKVQPYFTVALKGKKFEKDSKKLAKVKMKFDITPCPVEGGTFQAKKVVVSGSSTSFANLYFVFADGRKILLKKLTKKVPGGSYTSMVLEDGSIQLEGKNNFSGTGKLSMENPKKVTYEW